MHHIQWVQRPVMKPNRWNQRIHRNIAATPKQGSKKQADTWVINRAFK